MLSRRAFLVGIASFTAALPALAHPFKLEPKYEPQIVPFQGYDPGSIVVHPRSRFLFRVESVGTATRYGIGIGRAGLEFTGSAVVGDKAEWPSWRPTEQMIRRSPEKYARFAEGLPGGPGNPLGARALYLYRNGRDTMYRIHGTNEPQSIGKAVSNGCIRMLNEHVVELYERTPIGTFVFVV